MEQDFRTTFIPKRPVTAASPSVRVARPMGILTLIGFLLILVVLALAAGLWVYRGSLQKQVDDAKTILSDTEKFFEPQVLSELRSTSRRMNAASWLLDHHTAVSPFFNLLSESTLPQVRFSRLDIVLDGDRPTVTLSGEAEGYRVIAQQSRVFGQYSSIRDHLFSNFILTPRGRVSFDVVMNPDARLMTFKNRLTETSVPRASTVTAPVVPTSTTTGTTNPNTNQQ